MSEQPRGSAPEPESAPVPAPEPEDPPRLEPRPLRRPEVDAAESAVFSRPDGVDGSFAPAEDRVEPQGLERAQPPSEALASAFGRPSGSDETLQRDPEERSEDDAEQPFWAEGCSDPWRDPRSETALGPPASDPGSSSGSGPQQRGPLLSAREVVFGQRVRPRSLLALAAVAVVLGGTGGLVGRLTAEEPNPLTNPDVTLAQPKPAPPRPVGSVAGVAQRVSPAVVSVETHVGAQGGAGSGVVIDRNGYVLTNNHVISMAADTPNAQVQVVFQGDQRVPARVAGRDPQTDLAVLKVDVANPTVAPLGRSANLSPGDDVVAIGSPLQLAGTVTSGIISAVHRPVRLSGDGSDTNAVIDAVQTDAAINPGNSGGALVDRSGSVVGINSAIRSLGASGPDGQGGSIGLGFAIPVDQARQVAEELIRTGHVQHADLGVNARSVSDGPTDGAQVQNVRDGSAGAAAGLAEGDVITQVGDRRVTGADELVVAVNGHRPGDSVPITTIRRGRQLVLDARLG
jgi:S1-C subfamily serine protease